MNFMQNFLQKAARFFMGRNGADKLCYGIVTLCVVLSVINLFLHNLIIMLVIDVLFIYALFRVMSKNIFKRQQENARFVKFISRFEPSFRLLKRRFKEGKTYRFRKCRHCKKVLRLPIKRGVKSVKCPNCHDEFKTIIIL